MKEQNEVYKDSKVLCVIKIEGKILVSKGHDKVKDETFYRLLGGTLEVNEKPDDAMRREIREELFSEINDLKFESEFESSFNYNGQEYLQKIYLYAGGLSDESLYSRSIIHVIEKDYEFDAEWVKIEDVVSGKIILYPSYNWAEYFKK